MAEEQQRPQLGHELKVDDDNSLKHDRSDDSGIETYDGASLTSETSAAAGSGMHHLGDNWSIVSFTTAGTPCFCCITT
jgi:hypothetical protein